MADGTQTLEDAAAAQRLPAGTAILLGTTKGLFVLRSDGAPDWTVEGPHCPGWRINHSFAHGGWLFAAGGDAFNGAGIWRSADHGATWTLAKLADGEIDAWIRNDPATAAFFGAEPAPPAPFTGQVDALWSLGRVGDTLLAGGKPGVLFASHDDGATWAAVDGINGHPGRDSWNPGAAGLTLHTIQEDPQDANRAWVAISAAGIFATEDGGATWETRNRLSNVEACHHHDHPAAPRDGQTGMCVHHLGRDADGTLFQQNHHGVYRSRDGGRSWDDITAGLPSTFGFAMAVDPVRPGTLWTHPLADDMGRFPPGAASAVWRSTGGGETWQECRAGLPQRGCHFTVLRQGMAAAAMPQDGALVAFGTNTGSVFASSDRGDSWHEIARHLPTILSVGIHAHPG